MLGEGDEGTSAQKTRELLVMSIQARRYSFEGKQKSSSCPIMVTSIQRRNASMYVAMDVPVQTAHLQRTPQVSDSDGLKACKTNVGSAAARATTVRVLHVTKHPKKEADACV